MGKILIDSVCSEELKIHALGQYTRTSTVLFAKGVKHGQGVARPERTSGQFRASFPGYGTGIPNVGVKSKDICTSQLRID